MANRSNLPRGSDLSIAYKALNLMMHLTRAEVGVAGLLLSHFNQKTGQCDPSVERLSTLLGIGRASVLRATKSLSEGELRLFDKNSHGGYAHRASYSPRWHVFRSFVEKVERDLKGGNVSELRRSRYHQRDSEGLTDDTQTHRTNSENKLNSADAICGDAVSQPCSRVEEPRTQSVSETRYGLMSGSVRRPPVPSATPARVAISITHKQAAEQSATRRWDADLRALGWQAHADAIERITPEIAEAATQAELKRKGGGLRLVLESLGGPVGIATRVQP
ncbi:hypothetical protein GOB15_23745 [Sinorhizobium meliloti]|nr:hypothetical protein [Sinorhizobium meliloti]MDW9512866.1 hypothetical protein [Sinorhizobium meliloti]